MILNYDFRQCISKCASEIFENIEIQKGVFLITGATGLIGSVLVDCLIKMNYLYSAEFRTIAIAKNKERATERFGGYYGRRDFQFVSCDVNDPLPDVGRIDYLIHAASNTHPLEYSSDPIGTIKTNVIGTNNLLDYAMRHQVKRFVFLSSVEIYGENKGELEAFSELDYGYLDCNQVRSGYPESKRVGESLCRAYESKYGMDVVIPRLCRVYGPTMWLDDSKALAQFIKSAVNCEDIVLKSKGNQYYSYIHVLDAVKAIFYIIDKGKRGEAYNVSSKLSNIRLIDLANKLAKISGKKVVFEIPDDHEKKGYSCVTKAILNNDKLKLLGWNEIYDIEEGLRMTVKILKNLE